MTTQTYDRFRGNLETYFDKTASKAWEQLTSDAPVSGVRATVRKGRTEMRDTLLSWLPADMTGLRLLDAGCGTGALAVEAAIRGAEVVAIDVAGSLVDVARKRAHAQGQSGLNIDWRVGDLLDPALGRFDHVVAMDSLIHYKAFDIVAVLRGLSDRTRGSMMFTFAPQTPLLMVALGMGRLFPSGDRSPAIIPVRERLLRTLIRSAMPTARLGRDRKVSGGFYTSHALEVVTA
ncbi:magnesium protoporphyrin IX methyltransferase [Sphingomonas psychrolutea]|uniref:Magnesium protoporphyrin IX methyltransferase n=1 Tax=Sphingomonas psychrolutea TaxID=1259676 RepID=A0ABQ1GKY4_9SPHN|nr:magnesium protoporphyrin IX methyltransferase [Sphingomonas psychrolutea]GGA45962.1 magnesium protoporphyrin IX methyltransferase [Sphingomonas psychrolutea]